MHKSNLEFCLLTFTLYFQDKQKACYLYINFMTLNEMRYQSFINVLTLVSKTNIYYEAPYVFILRKLPQLYGKTGLDHHNANVSTFIIHIYLT